MINAKYFVMLEYLQIIKKKILIDKLNFYKLQSRLTKIEKHSKRYSLKKALLRLSLKIENLVDECHKKTTKWLCQNYNTIIIPKLNFHGIKKMSKKNKNKLIVWKHCSFVDRLVDKSREYNCNVVQVTEEYTSKTCGCCGFIKRNLYGSKTFKCDKCKNVIDRDINGARNILLKYYTETASKSY